MPKAKDTATALNPTATPPVEPVVIPTDVAPLVDQTPNAIVAQVPDIAAIAPVEPSATVPVEPDPSVVTKPPINDAPDAGTAPVEQTPEDNPQPVLRFFRLATPGTSFVDPETNFRLVNDEVKAIGPGAGKLTMQWIHARGIIEVDSPLDRL